MRSHLASAVMNQRTRKLGNCWFRGSAAGRTLVLHSFSGGSEFWPLGVLRDQQTSPSTAWEPRATLNREAAAGGGQEGPPEAAVLRGRGRGWGEAGHSCGVGSQGGRRSKRSWGQAGYAGHRADQHESCDTGCGRNGAKMREGSRRTPSCGLSTRSTWRGVWGRQWRQERLKN